MVFGYLDLVTHLTCTYGEGMTLDLSSARQIKLHRSAQALLYDIAKRVRSGYHWWVTGAVPASKILAVTAKLIARYDTTASAVTRSRRKAAGDASVTLMVWPLRNDPVGYTTRFGFLLLATEHLDGEVMYDGRRKPVRVDLYANGNAVFHLMPEQVTVERKALRPGPKPKRKTENQMDQKPMVRSDVKWVYDWRLSAKSLELMRQRFRAALTDPAALLRLRKAYVALPMTSSYRRQLRTVLTEAKVTWKMTHTPRVVAARQAIKEGRLADPFAVSTLPYIRGFPTLYDTPAMTLGLYLDATEKARKEVERHAIETVQADHTEIPLPLENPEAELLGGI